MNPASKLEEVTVWKGDIENVIEVAAVTLAIKVVPGGHIEANKRGATYGTSDKGNSNGHHPRWGLCLAGWNQGIWRMGI